jgi:predicted MFS family arabinose efflux permease
VASADRTRLTYRLELQRAVPHGVLESAGSTFLLLIALKYFEAGAMAKALVASGGSVGLMLAPVVVSQVARRRWPAALAAARFAAVGAAVFLVMALVPWVVLYVVGCMVAMTAATSVIPLMTQIYQDNYPEDQRGKLYSRTVMLRIAVHAGFSGLAGQLLEADLRFTRLLLVLFAASFAFAAWRLTKYPSEPLHDDGGTHPFRAMRYVRDDRLFRYTLICWMLMGFANLMMLPLRIEYLGHPRYHLELSAVQIALLIGVVPNVARLAMNQVWGRLFDRMNFLVLRVVLNAGFAISILTFFLSDSMTGLVLGSLIFGISNSGGDVAWGLWVTKLAPAARVADYMSVHVFFTGLRGVIAPVAAFHLASHFSLTAIGIFCAGLIVLASALLLPEIRWFQSARRGQPVVDSVAE